MTALKFITIILFVILTIVTVQIHPKMHQAMVIENANFKLERISDKYINQNIKVSTQTNVNQEKPVAVKEVTPADVKTIKTQSRTSQRNLDVRPQKQTSNEITVDIPQNTEDQLALLQRIIDESQKTSPQTSTPNPQHKQPQQTQTTQKPKTGGNPYMTEQEEIIAWNKWRSDIQNKIMLTSNIGSAPMGTLFMFSFGVDKYGNISNINVWSLDPNYTPTAKRQVKPAIVALQGQPILRFPRGTQRTSTIVAGSFMIAMEDRLSSPSDFADYERLR